MMRAHLVRFALVLYILGHYEPELLELVLAAMAGAGQAEPRGCVGQE